MDLQACANVTTVLALLGTFIGAALAAYQSKKAHQQGVQNGNDLADLVKSLEPMTKVAGEAKPPTN